MCDWDTCLKLKLGGASRPGVSGVLADVFFRSWGEIPGTSYGSFCCRIQYCRPKPTTVLTMPFVSLQACRADGRSERMWGQENGPARVLIRTIRE